MGKFTDFFVNLTFLITFKENNPHHKSFSSAMKIAIFGNSNSQNITPEIIGLLTLLKAQLEAELVFEPKFKAMIQSHAPQFGGDAVLTPASPVAAELALSFGGDGALLRAAKWVFSEDIPIMGINTGHLGYLTTTGTDKALSAITRFFAGEMHISERTMLNINSGDVPIRSHFALNDIAVLRQDTSSMLQMTTTVNDAELTTYVGDGLVVSTPTGSTAYNLSAGGPILAPDTRCIILTPVSPHTLNMRPLVIDDNAVIRISTVSRAPQFLVSVDGESYVFPSGSEITIKRAKQKVKIVQIPHHNFAHTLRHKLLWGQ